MVRQPGCRHPTLLWNRHPQRVQCFGAHVHRERTDEAVNIPFVDTQRVLASETNLRKRRDARTPRETWLRDHFAEVARRS